MVFCLALCMSLIMVVLDMVGTLPSLSDWRLRNLADLTAWQSGIPWRSLLTGEVLMGGSAWLTLRRFQRTDY